MNIIKQLGPGLVAGASDVDPTTVASMSVIGASTVYALSWLTVLVFPMLAVIQAISSQIGVAAKNDLQSLVRQRYGRFWQYLFMGSILSVTILTIAADLGAGAAALGLMTHLGYRWFIIPLGLLILGLFILGTYDEIQRVLKYVLLILLAYVVTAFMARPDWGSVLGATIVPHLQFSGAYWSGALALLGTSLTSYVYVWQTVEIAQEQPSMRMLRPKMADAISGMFFAVAIFWSILITTAATLGVHHQQVETAQQAAQALAPFAGNFASYIFGIGLLGSSLLALPVLMGTAAYVVSAQFDYTRGLSRKVKNAPRFYAVALFAIFFGGIISFTGISPIHLLFIASIAGGIATPIGLVFLLLIAGDRKIMKGRPVGRILLIAGWLIAILVSIISVVYLIQQLLP